MRRSSTRRKQWISYCRLTLTLIENYENLTTRHFLLQNFMNSFSLNQSIPLSIVAEALIKHAQTQDSHCVVSLQFYSFLANCPQLTVRSTI